MNFNSADLAAITNGTLTGPPDLVVSELVTDSRQVSFAENAAFFAIRGANHDGHQFIDTLYHKGVKVFIVEKLPEEISLYPDGAFILTGNAIEALQLLAAAKRKAFKSTIIAITGSTGKTIVKEWLADVLGRSYPVLRSPKSYNSQVGVPLSVWKLEEKYKFGIFEAGISMPGEMEKLQRVINPDIGIITNIGDAHNENFPDNTVKTGEKLKLFVNSSMIIYCSDQPIVASLILKDNNLGSKNLVDWSFQNNKAKVFVKKKLMDKGSTTLQIR